MGIQKNEIVPANGDRSRYDAMGYEFRAQI